MKSAWVILLTVLAAGCTQPPPPANQATEARPTRDYVRAVIALTPKQRDGVLYKAIGDAGLSCPSVSGSVRVPSPDTRPRWRAHCSDDTDHLVEVAPDGNALVISRIDSD